MEATDETSANTWEQSSKSYYKINTRNPMYLPCPHVSNPTHGTGTQHNTSSLGKLVFVVAFKQPF
jgi:hypothetical protein